MSETELNETWLDLALDELYQGEAPDFAQAVLARANATGTAESPSAPTQPRGRRIAVRFRGLHLLLEAAAVVLAVGLFAWLVRPDTTQDTTVTPVNETAVQDPQPEDPKDLNPPKGLPVALRADSVTLNVRNLQCPWDLGPSNTDGYRSQLTASVASILENLKDPQLLRESTQREAGFDAAAGTFDVSNLYFPEAYLLEFGGQSPLLRLYYMPHARPYVGASDVAAVQWAPFDVARIVEVPVAALQNSLEELVTPYRRYRVNGFDEVQKLPMLSRWVEAQGMDDKAIESLAWWRSRYLTVLSLSNASAATPNTVSSRGFKAFQRSPSLIVLDISSHRALSEAEVLAIGELEQLRCLIWDGGQSGSDRLDVMTQDGLSALTTLANGNLKLLDLSRHSLHRHGLKWLRGTKLESLGISGTDIESNDLSHISGDMKNLLDLDISECGLVGESGIGELTGLARQGVLQTLDLSSTGLGDAAIERLVKGFTITSGGREINYRFTKLQTLRLCNLRKLTDKALVVLPQLEGLRTLDLTGCTQFDDWREFAKLQAALPDCEITMPDGQQWTATTPRKAIQGEKPPEGMVEWNVRVAHWAASLGDFSIMVRIEDSDGNSLFVFDDVYMPYDPQEQADVGTTCDAKIWVQKGEVKVSARVSTPTMSGPRLDGEASLTIDADRWVLIDIDDGKDKKGEVRISDRAEEPKYD